MKPILFLLIFAFIFSCASKKTLPKASLVRDTERLIEKAEKSIITQDNSAKELIDTSLTLSIATNIPDFKIRSYLLKVNYDLKEGSLDNALKNLSLAKEIALKEYNEYLPYIVYYEYLLAYITNNQEKINQLLTDNTDYPDNVLTAIDILKSLIYIKSNNLYLAEKYANNSLRISNKKNLPIEKSFALKLLSYIQFKRNNLKEALNRINEALIIDRSLNLLDYLYWNLEFLAKIHLINDDKEKSLYYYKSAYELALLNKNKTKSEYYKSIIDNLLK